MSRKSRSSRFPLRMVKLLTTAIALIGLLLSLYLLKEHLAPSGSTFCDVNSKVSCDIVNKSDYATILSIPVSLLGAIFWGVIFFMTLFSRSLESYLHSYLSSYLRKTFSFTKLFRAFLFCGVLFSAYLSFIEAFVLKVWCPLCVLSALSVLIVFLLSFLNNRL